MNSFHNFKKVKEKNNKKENKKTSVFKNFKLLKPKLCEIILKFNCNNKKKINKYSKLFNIK